MVAKKKTAKRTEAAEFHRAVLGRIEKKLDKYLPEEGELRPWTISELEAALSVDMNDIARDVIESRIDIDPSRVPEKKPVCPVCGKPVGSVVRERSAHKTTAFGRLSYKRTYAACHACGVAFSPSGHCVRIRQGLL